MRILGAVLAGGKSRRFGADKAAALLDGKRLIDHAADALLAHGQMVIIAGRDDVRWPCVNDAPKAGLGPLGGLCAALQYGLEQAFDLVLTSGCDVPQLPANVVNALKPAPAYYSAQPVIGLWPTHYASALDQHLRVAENRAIRHWAEAVEARAVNGARLTNINRPEDLVRAEAEFNPADRRSLR